jgi:hypothetical protein
MFQMDAWEAESQGPQTLSIGIENLWDSFEVEEEEFIFVCESSLWFLWNPSPFSCILNWGNKGFMCIWKYKIVWRICVTKFPMQYDWALFQEMNLGSWPSVLEKALLLFHM